MTSNDIDLVLHVALTLFAADSAALVADGIAPGQWADWDNSDEQDSYVRTAAGLIEYGVIAWPAAPSPTRLGPAAVETLAQVIHEDIDKQWPAWTDLAEHARAANRQYVQHLDAEGLINHTALSGG
uniref:hypothetical protein n=1 Tax=Nocardia sp. CA-095871 TaxID=3239971 RepID=UPI003F491DDD